MTATPIAEALGWTVAPEIDDAVNGPAKRCEAIEECPRHAPHRCHAPASVAVRLHCDGGDVDGLFLFCEAHARRVARVEGTEHYVCGNTLRAVKSARV